jgi:MFS family permease
MRRPAPYNLDSVRLPLIALLCLTGLGTTCTIGAFPALLPELGADARLRDWQLGVVAAAFGFARMVADVPIGLFIRRRLAVAFVVAPAVMGAGVVLLASAHAFPALVAGRVLMGVGQAIGVVAGLTALLQYYAGRRLGAVLNAFEFSAMIGLLAGAGLAATLPAGFSWRTVLLLAFAPQIIGLVLLPPILSALRPDVAETTAAGVTPAAAPSRDARTLVGLAFVAGALIAVTYTSVEQFIIPVRGSREFGLERPGLARLLMIIQSADLVALLPLGLLSDRRGPARVLGGVVLSVAAGAVLVGFGGVGTMALGCALFGVGMAGWQIPLSVLRRQTARELVAWRTALYRVGVDAGMFLGPFLSGLAGADRLGAVSTVLGAVLAGVGAVLWVVGRRASAP